MSYFVAYMFLLAIVNFMFTCAYSTVGQHKMSIATGTTTAGCCLAALVWLANFTS
jgi:hypothetical protein